MELEVKILVIEDDRNLGLLIVSYVKKMGYPDVTYKGDCDFSIDWMSTENFDLIIADWHLPGRSGLELFKVMQGREDLKKIPFLMLTSDDSTKELTESGIREYLFKSVDYKILKEKVDKLLSGK